MCRGVMEPTHRMSGDATYIGPHRNKTGKPGNTEIVGTILIKIKLSNYSRTDDGMSWICKSARLSMRVQFQNVCENETHRIWNGKVAARSRLLVAGRRSSSIDDKTHPKAAIELKR